MIGHYRCINICFISKVFVGIKLVVYFSAPSFTHHWFLTKHLLSLSLQNCSIDIGLQMDRQEKGLRQDIETGCSKWSVERFLGVLFLKGNIILCN